MVDKDEEFEENIEENTEENAEDTSIEDMMSEENDLVDIVIEIDEDDLDFSITDVVEESKEEEEEEEDIVLSKHTIQGKHSLKYDSIFKGKKEDQLTEDSPETHRYSNEALELDKSSNYWFESVDNETYIKEKRVKERVYEVLSANTDISFLNNRRKPSKLDFNQYYSILKVNLKGESFTNIELFNELSVYFSDNLFNMFKLLDNKWRNIIINELQDHIGKQSYSHEVANKNIHESTEIEFENIGLDGIKKLITGVIIEIDYETSTYKVNSYENIYEIHISEVTKILNNTKFKYNLNKLNNIDFL